MPKLAPLVVIVGPIASGKSSVAIRISELLLDAGRRSAVVDLDDVVKCLVAPDAEWQSTWRRARQVHDELVAVFRRSGIDHVIAHGSFFYADEPSSLPDGVHDDTALRVRLSVPYDIALERVRHDRGRGITKDPEFLRWTHDQFAGRVETLPAFHLEFDTTVRSIEKIADVVTETLLR